MSKQPQGRGDPMVREVKLGLSVIALLVAALAAAVVWRAGGWNSSPPANIPSAHQSPPEVEAPPRRPIPPRLSPNPPVYEEIPAPAAENHEPAPPGGPFVPPAAREERPGATDPFGGAFVPVPTAPTSADPFVEQDAAAVEGAAGPFEGRPASFQQWGDPADRQTADTADNGDIPTEIAEEAPAAERIVAGKDDSFWSISERIYGRGEFFRALWEHNRRRFPRPERLRAGELIITPPAAELRRLYPELCPPP